MGFFDSSKQRRRAKDGSIFDDYTSQQRRAKTSKRLDTLESLKFENQQRRNTLQVASDTRVQRKEAAKGRVSDAFNSNGVQAVRSVGKTTTEVVGQLQRATAFQRTAIGGGMASRIQYALGPKQQVVYRAPTSGYQSLRTEGLRQYSELPGVREGDYE